MASVDLTSRRELLGHKSLAMTIRYAHLAPGHKRRAINMLDKVLKSTQEEALLHSFSSQFEDFEPKASNLNHKSFNINMRP
jgi:hypothetical protein